MKIKKALFIIAGFVTFGLGCIGSVLPVLLTVPFFLPGTEDMDREYHQKLFHVKVMLPVVPIAAVFGAVTALVMTLIW